MHSKASSTAFLRLFPGVFRGIRATAWPGLRAKGSWSSASAMPSAGSSGSNRRPGPGGAGRSMEETIGEFGKRWRHIFQKSLEDVGIWYQMWKRYWKRYAEKRCGNVDISGIMGIGYDDVWRLLWHQWHPCHLDQADQSHDHTGGGGGQTPWISLGRYLRFSASMRAAASFSWSVHGLCGLKLHSWAWACVFSCQVSLLLLGILPKFPCLHMCTTSIHRLKTNIHTKIHQIKHHTDHSNTSFKPYF